MLCRSPTCFVLPLVSLAGACATVASRPPELADPIYAGRHCDPSLVGVTVPTLTDVIDSTQAVAAISASAPEDSAWAWAKLTYGADGAVLEVELLHSDWPIQWAGRARSGSWRGRSPSTH